MEIEIKAKFEDKQQIIEKLISLQAVGKKQKHQIDDYYNHPERDLRKTNEYLRLRHIPGETKGIFAHHINISDGVNKEFEVSVDDIKTFKTILKALNFSLLGTIDKKRETYLLNDAIITLDEVKDIGNFIEVEVAGEETEIKEKKAQCLQILQTLGLSKEAICENIWLCDIATGKTTLK
jgi:adenylate cyclase class 2